MNQLPTPALRYARGGGVLAVASALMLSTMVPATAAPTTDPNVSPREIAHAALARQAAAEGMVLLENHGALPLADSGNVALFGPGANYTVKGGTGSGDVNNRITPAGTTVVSVRQAFEEAGYTVTTRSAYWDAMIASYSAPGGTGQYAAREVALTEDSAQPTRSTETAIYVLSRNSGEGADRSATAGDYFLNDVERANIAMLGRTYPNVVVALNVGGMIDTSFFEEINAQVVGRGGGNAIDGLMIMGQPGQEGGRPLVDVLNGTVTPSGKTVDTWASRYQYYPASATFANNDADSLQEDYSEGLYVGYRYFDSFYGAIRPNDPDAVVNYPFGYGLSYSEFEIETDAVAADTANVAVTATVTNTGDVAGKEVVQVYFSAPQTGLDKPYQELVGYAKTDVLAPGQSQTLEIEFPTAELASYDPAQAAYMLEAGDYAIRVGDSSRSTAVESVLEVADTVIVEQLANEMNDDAPENEWQSDPEDFFTYEGEQAEIDAASRVEIDFEGFVAPNNASPINQDVALEPSSDYFAIDGDTIAAVTAYVDAAETDWLGTGEPYHAKEGETIVERDLPESATLYDVARGDLSMEDFVATLTPAQLQAIVEGASGSSTTTFVTAGAAGRTTPTLEALGVPATTLVDGPAGVRITRQYTRDGVTYYQYATAWPIATTLAQTWNTELMEAVGEAVGVEMEEFGAALWLAPALNIHRDPLLGRSFEYYSEDPLVSGQSTAAMTRGVQSVPGIGVTIKHFAANNQESQRMTQNATVSERVLREIYLKGFEIAVKESQPMSIMSSYNRINGTYAAGYYDLLNDVTRGEWGFDGLVMTDWGGMRAGVTDAMYAGNELLMPGPGFLGGYNGEIVDALLGVTTPANIQMSIDVAGMPHFIRANNAFSGGPLYNWRFGPWRLNAGGEVFATTTVDAARIANQPTSGNGGFSITSNVSQRDPAFASVHAAYEWVQDVIERPNAYTLSESHVAGIEVAITAGTPDAVTEFTVTLRGNQTQMRLGDLQRSAARILHVLSNTRQFEELAGIQGADDIEVAPYTEQYADDLSSFLAVDAAPVLGVALSDEAPETGWYTSPVDVLVTLGDPESDTATVTVDDDAPVAYEGPFTVDGDGVREVRVAATNDSGATTVRVLTVSIDATAPAVAGSLPASGELTVEASDDASGVESVEYSEDGGTTWTAYEGPVAVADSGASVQVRATDVAGNTSAAVTVVPGVSFVDVSDDPSSPAFSEHAAAIGWLAAEGISTGWTTPSGQEFRPVAGISRDAMAAFLYRYAGSPEVVLPAESPFVDVTPSSTEFYTEIVWMYQEGISTGWESAAGREYRPLAGVSRDAMAAFLYRFAGEPAWTDPAVSPFIDVTSTSTEFYTEITWLADTGISTGWDTPAGDEFRPLEQTRRDAMAAFLYRFDQLPS